MLVIAVGLGSGAAVLRALCASLPVTWWIPRLQLLSTLRKVALGRGIDLKIGKIGVTVLVCNDTHWPVILNLLLLLLRGMLIGVGRQLMHVLLLHLLASLLHHLVDKLTRLGLVL